jgi:hypothetical protein
MKDLLVHPSIQLDQRDLHWLILYINKVFLLVLPVRQRCTEGRFGRPRTFENRKEKSYDLKKGSRLKMLPSSMSCMSFSHQWFLFIVSLFFFLCNIILKI